MALTYHDNQEFVSGDDWTITGQLLDITGSALDLTNATLVWTLIDPNGNEVAGVVGAAVITPILGTTGGITIKVPAANTSGLDAGRYHDGLRVSIGATSLYWRGAILVACDPFSLVAPS